MYPDPITPRSFPDLLQDADYDPFSLMPGVFPSHPRLLVTHEQLQRARRHVKTCAWAANAFERLKNSCAENPLRDTAPVPSDPDAIRPWVERAERYALAFLLTDERSYRDQALTAFRRIAGAMRQSGTAGFGGSLADSRMIFSLASCYDMLSATGLDGKDNGAFRALVENTVSFCDLCPHFTCGNHNTWSLVARLAVGLALGERQHVHDALYGCDRGRTWRYGLIHQLRHDILADGLHWERSSGYHLYTLMGLTEAACMLEHCGIDLWRRQLPAQHQDDGHDLHRAYEQRGGKSLKAAFDAPFYLAFPNGDLAILNDSGIGNLAGVHVWGIVYNKAYEAYGDPKYAWLLHHMELSYPAAERTHPELPMPLNTNRGDIDFARLRDASYPNGALSLSRDCRIALRGRHQNGSTLFPVHGTAVLRSDPTAVDSIGAFLSWGPHSAGHQSPAALHLDMWAKGRRMTDAPRSTGYDDPMHLTWFRTTIAHNTVTVDQASMFPYDCETDSLWEADRWRDRVSDGKLESFQLESTFKAVRASNENVYPDVRLDRTVVVTANYILDVYRVLSKDPHMLDWTMHVVGTLLSPTPAEPADLGDRRGYRHLSNVREAAVETEPVALQWRTTGGVTHAVVLPPEDSRIITARDPIVSGANKGMAFGEHGAVEPRSTVIVRSHAASALFLSLWHADDCSMTLSKLRGDAESDLVLKAKTTETQERWKVPFIPGRVEREEQNPSKGAPS